MEINKNISTNKELGTIVEFNQDAPHLGPVYTKRQRQCCDNAAMTLAILFSLKTMESLQNGVATHFQATPLFSMKTESQASSQRCRSIDADAWCKRALTISTFAKKTNVPFSLVMMNAKEFHIGGSCF